MSNPFDIRKPNTVDEPPAPASRFRFGAKFSPHILVFMLTLYAAVPPLRGTIVAVVNLWWDKTYAKVDFIMDEGHPNEGSPYIAGHLDGSTELYLIGGVMQGSTVAVEGVPTEAFAPNKRIQIWDSPEGPRFGVFGASINGVPVAAQPERPGWASLLLHLVWLYLTFVVGLRATAWVAKRWSRTWGELPMDRRSRTRLGGV